MERQSSLLLVAESGIFSIVMKIIKHYPIICFRIYQMFSNWREDRTKDRNLLSPHCSNKYIQITVVLEMFSSFLLKPIISSWKRKLFNYETRFTLVTHVKRRRFLTLILLL